MRRVEKLRIAQMFWNDPAVASSDQDRSPSVRSWQTDSDPFDFVDPPNGFVNLRGLIIRTDFSNKEAWDEFLRILADSEKSGKEDLLSTGTGAEPMEVDDEEDEDESSDEEDEENVDPLPDPATGSTSATSQPPFAEDASAFIIIDPSVNPAPHIAPEILLNASNIALLRLFNDVDIIPVPSLPPSNKRIKPATNPLVDHTGFQEVYHGRLIWVYDSTSNRDGSVRAVRQKAGIYGTATGDSWRARARPIWELHVSLDSGALDIDFGTEDRYDWSERKRNFEFIGVST
jgi:hypothetical protein